MSEESIGDWLPLWIVVARWVVLPVGTFLAVSVLARVAEWVLLKGPVPKEPLAWPENAHALQRVGSTSVIGVLLTGMTLWLFLADPSLGGTDPPRKLLALLVLAGYAAFVSDRRRLLARHGGLRLRWGEIVRARLAFAALMSWPLYAFVVLLVFGRNSDPYPRARFAVGGALLLFLWLGGAVWLARRFGILRPAGERLRACVARVAERAGIAAPAAFEVEMVFPNAFALLLSGGIAVTSAALECFEDPELEAVVAHELGHLRERRAHALFLLPGLAATFCALWAVTLAQAALGWWWLAFPIGAIVLWFGHVRLMRSAERRADAFAHAHADPASLARALEILHRALILPPRFGKGATHPDLVSRQLAAGVTPHADSRAPRPGKRHPAVIALLSGGVVLAAAFTRDILCAPQAGAWRARTLLVLRGPDPFSLARLAEHELAAERPRAAHALFRAGALLDPENPWWTMQETAALLADGDCAAARQRLAESERRSATFPPEDSAEWYAWARAALADCR